MTEKNIFAKLNETVRLFGLLFSSATRCNPERIYSILSTHNNLAEKSLYLNLGYWKSASTYDGACEALAELLGQHAGLNPEDRVLDAGCGFGDQDYYWLNRFSPSSITAINITRSQIAKAIQRFVDNRLQFMVADAVVLPFEDLSFDKVLALESAFHFEPREAFFSEAARVLQPGGILALADVVPIHLPASIIGRRIAKIGRALWQTPECNTYSKEAYIAKLKAAGFSDIKIISIAEYVFAPFKKFARKRVLDSEIRKRVHPILRKIWAASHGGLSSLDYLIITAVRQ
jgi:microcystin synthetase protein McyJ